MTLNLAHNHFLCECKGTVHIEQSVCSKAQ